MKVMFSFTLEGELRNIKIENPEIYNDYSISNENGYKQGEWNLK